MKNIDFVVTYVDSQDPEWRIGYNKMCERKGVLKILSANRYREWNTLKFIFRGVDKCMPWIRNVYLVVQRQSQIPSWVNTDNVKVVFHSDIIPERYLPIYNSTGIELFLYKIPGLAEKFLYANDDMIPLSDLSPSDFYDKEDNPKLCCVKREFNKNSSQYMHHLHNGLSLVCEILGEKIPENYIITTGHSIAPMLKSTWELLWREKSSNLSMSISPFRTHDNINQDVAQFMQILTNKYTTSIRNTKYMEMKDIESVCKNIEESNSQILCINDQDSISYEYAKKQITTSFMRRFPSKSKYEK